MTEASPAEYDVVIRGGTLYDGSGNPGFIGDLANTNDRIVALGDIGDSSGCHEIDAAGIFRRCCDVRS